MLAKEDGSALIFTVALVGILGYLFLFGMLSRSSILSQTGVVYRSQNASQELNQEINVIFSNPSLCTSLVAISGHTFTIGSNNATLFSPPPSGTAGGGVSVIPNLTIQEMSVSSPITVPGGLESKFTILSTIDNDPTHQSRQAVVSAIYILGGGGALSSCQILMDKMAACQEIGANWIGSPATGRCGICEMLGGTWTGTSGPCTGL